MFFIKIVTKNTACRITPIYRLEAGSGGAGGGGAGGGGAGGGGGWRIIFISNLQKAPIYQQLT